MEQTTNLAPCWRTILHGSLVLLYILPCMSGMQGRVTFKQDLGLCLQQKTFKDQVMSLWGKDKVYLLLTIKKADAPTSSGIFFICPTTSTSAAWPSTLFCGDSSSNNGQKYADPLGNDFSFSKKIFCLWSAVFVFCQHPWSYIKVTCELACMIKSQSLYWLWHLQQLVSESDTDIYHSLPLLPIPDFPHPQLIPPFV